MFCNFGPLRFHPFRAIAVQSSSHWGFLLDRCHADHPPSQRTSRLMGGSWLSRNPLGNSWHLDWTAWLQTMSSMAPTNQLRMANKTQEFSQQKTSFKSVLKRWWDGKFQLASVGCSILRPEQSSTPSFPARVWSSLSMCSSVGALVIIETYGLGFRASEHWAAATPVVKEKGAKWCKMVLARFWPTRSRCSLQKWKQKKENVSPR